jgi:hypothetical protein
MQLQNSQPSYRDETSSSNIPVAWSVANRENDTEEMCTDAKLLVGSEATPWTLILHCCVICEDTGLRQSRCKTKRAAIEYYSTKAGLVCLNDMLDVVDTALVALLANAHSDRPAHLLKHCAASVLCTNLRRCGTNNISIGVGSG